MELGPVRALISLIIMQDVPVWSTHLQILTEMTIFYEIFHTYCKNLERGFLEKQIRNLFRIRILAVNIQ